MDGRKQEIWSILPVSMRECFHRSGLKIDRLQEIRIRVGKPVVVVEHDEEFFLGTDGRLMQSNEGTCFIASKEHVKECMEYISRYSLYAFEEEMKQGFITIQGGHRIGIAGKVIVRESRIHNMRHVSFVNIRISHEIPGCADLIMPYIICGRQVLSTLIISPPRCGKTTLLRDVIRQISNGCGMISGRNVGVVDERSELGACYLGIPQNDLGIRTDVLDCCPKAEGMMMLIRSMAPSVIAVDEIGSKEELEALTELLDFMKVLVPAFSLSLATVTGSVTSSAFYQMNLMGMAVADAILMKMVLPGTQIYFLLNMANYFMKDARFTKMAELVYMFLQWILKTSFGIIVGLQGIQMLLYPVIDQVKRNAMWKTASAIPGMGGLFGTVTETILGTGVIIKSAVGIGGLIGICLICMIPMMKLLAFTLVYRITSALLQPISDSRVVSSLEIASDSGKMLLSAVVSSTLLFLLSIAIVLQATNRIV